MINISTTPYDNFLLLHFTLPEGNILPSELINIKLPDTFSGPQSTKGIIISGRGPIWLFAYLCHHFHPAPWVATQDPRLGGAVIVQSHTPDRQAGEVINWADLKKI